MYLNWTEEWRRVNNETQLVLSYIQSHKQMVPSTISGWLKNVLKSSAINVSLLTAHSTRSATTSKKSTSGWSMIEILDRGTWSSVSTWQRFYKKDIIQIRVENFQNSVMGGTKWRCEQRKETWGPVNFLKSNNETPFNWYLRFYLFPLKSLEWLKLSEAIYFHGYVCCNW